MDFVPHSAPPRSRRTFLQQTAVLAAASSAAGGLSSLIVPQPARGQESSSRPLPSHPILDTHQHLWNRSRIAPPWLEEAPEILRGVYEIPEYRAATTGLKIEAVYMEVDVAPADHRAEARHLLELISQAGSVTRAAVIGGRPNDPQFPQYLDEVASQPAIKGIRQVLHGPSTPQGYCLQTDFLRGLRMLGERRLMFDLCMRPGELADAVRLVRSVPETHFILDHCGNADPTAFAGPASSAGTPPSHNPDQWRRDIESLAAAKNVTCKISGIIARAPEGWTAEDLAPIVNHCLDTFGPDRVIFGSDWPVCLLGAPLLAWVSALHQILKPRGEEDQRKLWSENARKLYRL